MMPLFFHSEAHLWVVYALFLNGLLLTLLIRRASSQVSQLLNSTEAILVSAFLLSLLINAGLYLLFANLGLSASQAPSFLKMSGGAVSLILIALLLLTPTHHAVADSLASQLMGWEKWAICRFVIYGTVAVILFYNGALLEQVSDAWWHLSLANTLVFNMNFTGVEFHLSGISGREYPLLWHINLAVLKLYSSHSLPELFNAATPWLAAVKLMAIYVFAHVLTKNRIVATIAVALYILLPGLGLAYLRVSAFPSHVSYTAWFFAFFIAFKLLDNLALDSINADSQKVNSQSSLNVFTYSCRVAWNFLRSQWAHIATFLLASVVMYLTHTVELVWIFVAFAAYFISLLLVRSPTVFEPNWAGLHKWFGIILTLCLLVFSIFLVVDDNVGAGKSVDFLLAYLVPPISFVTVLMLSARGRSSRCSVARKVLSVLAIAVLIAIIDWQHLASAFFPELAYPLRSAHEWPLFSQGWFEGNLLVPGWHLQLRDGLVYLGLLSIPVAWVLAYLRPGRATWFLAVCASTALLFCVSPYLHTWFRGALNYHSSWRVALIIFHPIIYAVLLHALFDLGFKRGRVALVPTIGFLTAFIMLSSQSSFHFSGATVTAKRNAGSAQRHWNINYGQNYIYYDSSFRYTQDFNEIVPFVDQDVVLITDRATSYYASAHLPGGAINLHRHHGGDRINQWRKFNKMQGLCGALNPEAKQELAQILTDAGQRSRVLYLLNFDQANRNVRASCERNRHHIIIPFLNEHAELLFQGEFLALYEFKGLAP